MSDDANPSRRPSKQTLQISRAARAASEDASQQRRPSKADSPRWYSPLTDARLRAYPDAVQDWHGYVRFLSLPQMATPTDMPIERLYVEPRLAEERIAPDRSVDEWPETNGLLEEVVANQRLVILGDPGSGKSTLVSYIAWRLTRADGSPWRSQLKGIVPIPLILRELLAEPGFAVDYLDKGPECLLARFVRHDSGKPLESVEFIRSMCESGQAMLLLDGLDEVGDLDTRQALRSAVWRFIVEYPNVRTLLTSRVIGYDSVPFHAESVSVVTAHGGMGKSRLAVDYMKNLFADRSARVDADDARRMEVRARAFYGFSPFSRSIGADAPSLLGTLFPSTSSEEPSANLLGGGRTEVFQEYLRQLSPTFALRYVVPFDDARIGQFASNWYAQNESAAGRAKEQSEDLTRRVLARGELTQLARIPNLLTMIALIHRVYAVLPDGRALLYERIAQAYLETIDAFRKLGGVGFPLTSMKAWLGLVAFRMQHARTKPAKKPGRTTKGDGDQPGILIDRAVLHDWIAEAMADERGDSESPTEADRAEAVKFIDWIARRSGLLIPRSADHFAFTHLSFQEYFAAVYIAGYVKSTRWSRTVAGSAKSAEKAGIPADVHITSLRKILGLEVWRETIILLFELLAQERMASDDLAELLFEFEAKPARAKANKARRRPPPHASHIEMLARILSDSHSGLTEAMSRSARGALAGYVLRNWPVSDLWAGSPLPIALTAVWQGLRETPRWDAAMARVAVRLAREGSLDSTPSDVAALFENRTANLAADAKADQWLLARLHGARAKLVGLAGDLDSARQLAQMAIACVGSPPFPHPLDAAIIVADAASVILNSGDARSAASVLANDEGQARVTAKVGPLVAGWFAAAHRQAFDEAEEGVRVFRGHKGLVFSAAFSPDGTRVVTASDDHTARVWDAGTGREVALLRGHENDVNSAAFSPDGARVVTASEDNTARVWDATSGREVALLRGHEGLVRSAAFSPDGARVVTASDDTTARVWDAGTGREVALLRGHKGLVFSAAFSPDGARVVTASEDNTARVWDATSGREVALLRGHEGLVRSAAFSPDGARVVTASDDTTARVWDAGTGREVALLRGHKGLVFSAAFSPDGARVVTASEDNTARVWDATSGREVALLRGHEGLVRSAAFSPDGARVVTASDDTTARVWDAGTGREVVLLRGHEGSVRSAAFSPDGASVVTASYDNTARVWDATSGREVALLRGHENDVSSAAFSPDGASVVTASYDNTARVWDATSGREVALLRGHENDVNSAAFSPDGASVVTASYDNTARVWDATSGREVALLRRHEAPVRSAAFSPDGARVVTASEDNTARVWDATSGREVALLRRHEAPVRSAAFSPDGARVVTASEDNTARVWDATSGREVALLRRHEGWVRSAAFSPDGTRVVTASEDNTARVWDAGTGREVALLRGHEGWVFSAAFSPDGTRVVTASDDNTARVWDAASGEMLGILGRMAYWVFSAWLSPDATLVAERINGNEVVIRRLDD